MKEIDYKKAMEQLLTPQLLKEAVLSGRETLLMQAARLGQPELVRLLAPGSDRLALSENEHSALAAAAMNGHTECVRILLEKQAKEQCEQSQQGRYEPAMRALDLALDNGHWDCAQLIAEFTDVNRPFPSNSSLTQAPLEQAARHGRLDMLEFFLPRVSLEPFYYAQTKRGALEVALEAAASSSAAGRQTVWPFCCVSPASRWCRPTKTGANAAVGAKHSVRSRMAVHCSKPSKPIGCRKP